MGSGTSRHLECPPPSHQVSTRDISGKPVAKSMPILYGDTQTICRSNQVAPIVIKNCREEFQHPVDFKEPQVMGRLADHLTEHPLIRGSYFLVKDVNPQVDELNTLAKILAPNFRRARGSLPVYGMGQPTQNGLNNLVKRLTDEGFTNIIIMNLREDPVLFYRDVNDFVPYSLRHQDRLTSLLVNSDRHAHETVALEVQARKEVVDFAAQSDDSFYFYENPANLVQEVQRRSVVVEDDIKVTDEVYARLAAGNSNIRYTRVNCSPDGFPMDDEIDNFINEIKEIDGLFPREEVTGGTNQGDSFKLAVVCSCSTGIGATNVGMVMASLLLAHRYGDVISLEKSGQKEFSPEKKTGKTDNNGQFHCIEQLVELLPNGKSIKMQVDGAINLCGKLHNIREAISKDKDDLDNYLATNTDNQNNNQPTNFLKQTVDHMERYFMLICFEAFLHSEFKNNFRKSFVRWIRQRPKIYRLFYEFDLSEHKTNISLLTNHLRYLVADNHIGLDTLSSQWDVDVPNFRRVLGWPLFGMGQPHSQGLRKLVNHISHNLHHRQVVWINLRDDLVVSGDKETYSWRETGQLSKTISIPSITAAQIENLEEKFCTDLNALEEIEIYAEIDEPSTPRKLNKYSTLLEIVEDVKKDGSCPQLVYHRVPFINEISPSEKTYDDLIHIALQYRDMLKDEDGVAFVFSCRTGKGRTTTAMSILGLLLCHLKGFPYGSQPGEEERVCLRNARFTKGEYLIIQSLTRLLPEGQQVKREVDYILDQCFETMSPMHYHVREAIFVEYNKAKKAKTEADQHEMRTRAIYFLERYFFLILFNGYLHSERATLWAKSFETWFNEMAQRTDILYLLDNFGFSDFEATLCQKKHLRNRWKLCLNSPLPIRGTFI